VAAQLAASQEGLSSMEFVSYCSLFINITLDETQHLLDKTSKNHISVA
jgi:hypothetical protein